MAETTQRSESAEQRPLFTIVLHGGAGVIAPDLDGTPFRQALTSIITSAYAFAASLAAKKPAM